MGAYRQTFRRHGLLVIAPVVVASLIAGWFTFGAAPAYRSSASLWVDNGPAISSFLGGGLTSSGLSATADAIDPSLGGAGSPSSGGPAAPVGPAGLEAQVVSELLLSPGFDVAVAHASLLPRFLQSDATAGGFSPSVLLSGGGGALSPSIAEDAAASSLANDVTLAGAGPQVLDISYDGPSPAVARSVLRSLIRQLGAAGSAFGETIGKTASAFYQHALAAATSAAAGTEGALNAYAKTHPGANAQNDATFRALTTEVGLANARQASLQTASTQANTEADSSGGGATMKVIDPPTLPQGQVMGLFPKLVGVLGGAFGGAVMSVLVLIGLTQRPRTRWDGEVPAFARLAAWDARSRRRPAASAWSHNP